MKTIAVLDLLRTSYSEFIIPDTLSESPRQTFETKLPKLLVVASDKERAQNRGSYLISKNNLIIDDLIDQTGRINKSKIHSIEKIFLGLQFSLTVMPGGFFSIPYIANSPDNSAFYEDLLKKYLPEAKRYISVAKASARINSRPYTTVINIPDWIEDYNQDIILDAAKSSFSSPILLWNSVAACLGIQKTLREQFIGDGQSIIVYDYSLTFHSCSKIIMKEYDSRVIPSHHIFWNTENLSKKTIRSQYYPFTSRASDYHPFSDEFDLFMTHDGYAAMMETTHSASFQSEPPSLHSEPNHIKLYEKLSEVQIQGRLISRSQNPVSIGSAIFIQQKEAGLVPYLEECKALFMVTVTPEEDIILKPLVPYTETLPAGKEQQQNEIYGISLQEGTESVDFNLLFTTETNKDILRRTHLRTLVQKLNVSDELRNAPKEIPLKLVPTVFAGQGRAKVEIKVRDSKDEQVLDPVFLDWNEMELSGKTTEQIEDELPRSFPIDIPTVICSEDKFNRAFYGIEYYVKNNCTSSILELNKSTFIDKNAPGIEKLRRSSVFGSPKNNGYDYPKDPRTMEYVEYLFHKLEKEYKVTGNDKVLTQIAWTYHGEYFRSIISDILSEVEKAGYTGCGVAAQKQTCCANLLIEDADMLRFLRAFIARIEKPTSINGWCRAAYQVLMYNSSFLKPTISKPITEEELQTGMGRLTTAVFANFGKETIIKNIDMTMYFFFKGRKYHNGFCKYTRNAQTKIDKRNNELYENIKASLLSTKAAFTKLLIENYYTWSHGLSLASSLTYRNFQELGGFSFNAVGQSVPLESIWKAINDWDSWSQDPAAYWKTLQFYDFTGLPSTDKRSDIKALLYYYEKWLEDICDKGKLLKYSTKFLNWSSNRVWKADIAKILLGKGSLNIPLGDDD